MAEEGLQIILLIHQEALAAAAPEEEVMIMLLMAFQTQAAVAEVLEFFLLVHLMVALEVLV